MTELAPVNVKPVELDGNGRIKCPSCGSEDLTIRGYDDDDDPNPFEFPISCDHCNVTHRLCIEHTNYDEDRDDSVHVIWKLRANRK